MYIFPLTHGIGPGERNDRHDLAGFGRGLERVTGLDPWLPHVWPMAAFPEAHTSDGYMPGYGGALRGFQIEAGLYPDGVARPGGPTENTLAATLDSGRTGRRISADEVYRGAPPGTGRASLRRPADGGAKAALQIRKLTHRTDGPDAGNRNAKGAGGRTRPPIPTVPPPGIRRSVGAGGVNDHDDLLQAQRNLARLGYTRPVGGIGESTESRSVAVQNGLRAYQEAKGLKGRRADGAGRRDRTGAAPPDRRPAAAPERPAGERRRRSGGESFRPAAGPAMPAPSAARRASPPKPSAPAPPAPRSKFSSARLTRKPSTGSRGPGQARIPAR